MNKPALDGVHCPKCGDTFRSQMVRANRVRYQKCCNTEERFWQKVTKTDGCWIYGGCRDKWGYAHVGVGHKRTQAHRYAYELTKGPIPAGMLVLHSCDNPPCVNPAHLSVGTHGDNNADMDAKGRRVVGEQCPRSKLKEDQVREIASLRGKVTQRVLAERYGVDQSAIAAIHRGHSWKHLFETIP